jgi:Transposase DDE domain
MNKAKKETRAKKVSTVRHTRAIQRDRSKRPASAPPDEQVAKRIEEIVHPATLAQIDLYHSLGLRARILTLPVMMALVLSLLWQQTGSVNELVKIVQSECVLWVPPISMLTQQALATRLRMLPAELFLRVLLEILPILKRRSEQRTRPLPAELAWAKAHYPQVLACDGSTLDALLRKVGLLQEAESNPLAGKMFALLDLVTRLPTQVWYDEDAQAHDQTFLEKVLSSLPVGTLLIFDLGFTNFRFFRLLGEQGVFFITRAKSNLAFQVEDVLLKTAVVHDQLVWIGAGDDRQPLRLIAFLYQGKWYRYLTNDLNPAHLPVEYAVALYWQRWRIEDGYAIAKRLLGLAFFHCGAQNAVQLQLWATWILYAILVDLTDEVAQQLNKPFARISMEMVYRSLPFFTRAHHRGEADALLPYLIANADRLDLVKRIRSNKPSILRSLQLTMIQNS